MMDKKRVLFMCVGNSCRSQMAEGLLRNMAPDRFDVHSAGAVATGLNPRAVRVMAELGIDISGQESKRVERFAGQTFDYVVTVCDASQHDPCPVFLGKAGRRLNWPFEDPAYAAGDEEEVLAVFRHVRDQIKGRLERFLTEAAAGGPAAAAGGAAV